MCPHPHPRGDREIVMRAVAQNWKAISSASQELQADASIAAQVFARSGSPPQAIGLKVERVRATTIKQGGRIARDRELEEL